VTTVQPSRRGPNLPYSLVAGVTPCGKGWFLASAKVQGTVFALEEPAWMESFIDILDWRPAYSVIAVNAPIGYLGETFAGGRTCDREARMLLGRKRGSSIKSAPLRFDTPRDIDLLPDGLDAISRTLLPRYREVAVEMQPYRQRTVYEVHSDLSFYQLNGEAPMQWSKLSEKGREERRTLLETKVPGVERILDSEVPQAKLSHRLDAAAFVWSARRIFVHAAIRIPTDPEWDEQGIRMEIFR
jgi:predicted RNase H-like nuclease